MKLPWAGKNLPNYGQPRTNPAERIAYTEYIRSPAWAEKRQQVIERDSGRCQDCGGVGTQVHHLNYVRLFQEDLDDLVLLCAKCHRARHGKHGRKVKNAHKKR